MNTGRTHRQTYRPDEDFLTPPVSLTVVPSAPESGSAVTLTATLTNTARVGLLGTVLYLAVNGTGRPSALGRLAPGGSATRTWRTRLADDAEGEVSFTAHALFDVGPGSSDCTRASSSVLLPYRSLPGAFDNAGIASDDALTVADIDGSASSLSAQALAAAGLTPGAAVTYNGVTFTWPDTRPGNLDNVICSGQTVLLSGSGSRLAFLGTSTWGAGKGTARSSTPTAPSRRSPSTSPTGTGRTRRRPSCCPTATSPRAGTTTRSVSTPSASISTRARSCGLWSCRK